MAAHRPTEDGHGTGRGVPGVRRPSQDRAGGAGAARSGLVARDESGELLLDELVTSTYPLDAINEAIAATVAGGVRRNVVVLGGAE